MTDIADYKIVSFGDSFIFGSELKNNTNGSKSWVGIIANQLNVNYQTFAVPGCGNDHIARQLYSYFSNNSIDNTLAIINWTWACRWDFYIASEYEKWITVGPSCVPKKLNWLKNDTKANNIIEFYNEYAGNSVLWNNFRNLQTILAVQSYIKEKNINVIQTFMDYELFDQTNIELVPDYIKELQLLVRPYLEFFNENKNFIDWAKGQGFEISNPGLHPLDEAHIHASKLWYDRYRTQLFKS